MISRQILTNILRTLTKKSLSMCLMSVITCLIFWILLPWTTLRCWFMWCWIFYCSKYFLRKWAFFFCQLQFSYNLTIFVCMYVFPTNFGVLWGIHEWSDFFSRKGEIPSSILLFIMLFWNMAWPWHFQELFIMYWESCSEDLSKFLLLIQFLWPYKVKILASQKFITHFQQYSKNADVSNLKNIFFHYFYDMQNFIRFQNIYSFIRLLQTIAKLHHSK